MLFYDLNLHRFHSACHHSVGICYRFRQACHQAFVNYNYYSFFFPVFFFYHPVTHAWGHFMSFHFPGSQEPVSNHWAENLIKIRVNNYNEWNKTALRLLFYEHFMHIYHEMAGSLELWHYRVIIKKINLYLLFYYLINQVGILAHSFVTASQMSRILGICSVSWINRQRLAYFSQLIIISAHVCIHG